MIESWRNIPGYKGILQADREGNIRRVYKSGKTRVLTPYRKWNRKTTYVRLSFDGNRLEGSVPKLVALTFLGNPKDGQVVYHKNGMHTDNNINNLAYITREDLGKMTGPMSQRRPVAKIGSDGEMIEFYTSAREAGRKNYCSYQSVIDHCNWKVKSSFGDFDFAWDDSEISLKKALERMCTE